MKVLIVKTSSMGDLVHTLPTARDMARAIPGIEIDWLSEESFADIPALSPHVSHVYRTAFRRWRKTPLASGVRAEVRALRHALAAERYDLVLDLQGLLRSGWAASWTRSRVAGYSFRTVREPAAAFFYDVRLDLGAELGAVRRSRMAAARALGYEIDAEHPVFGLKTAAPQAIDTDALGTFAVFVPNASRESKCWPEERWIETGRWLAARGVRALVFWGNDKERERSGRLVRAVPGAVLAPRTRLAEAAAIMRASRLMLGVDTGLSHLGAALGVPGVGIYTTTPSSILGLCGDGGPHLSVGGSGAVPEAGEVKAALQRVLTESEPAPGRRAFSETENS